MSNSNLRWISVSVAALLLLSGFQMLMDNDGDGALSLLDMTAKWSFDEGTGNTAEDGARDNDLRFGDLNGTDAADPLWADGVSGSCLDFNGLDDYAMITDFDMPFNAFTVSFWIKTSHSSSTRVPISYGTAAEENEFLLYNCQDLEVHLKALNVDTGISLTDGNWHHVAISWQSSDGNIRVYKDSELRYNYTLIVGESLGQDGALVLGQEQDVMGGDFEVSQAFIGKLDEVIILEKVLDQSEIEDYYDEFDLPPSNFDATAGDGNVLLKWEEAGDPDDFNIHRTTAQNGLLGEYFPNENFTDKQFSRVDPNIDLRWGTDSPKDGFNDDHFSVRWTGFIEIERSDLYDFFLVNDDMARLFVNGSLVYDDHYTGGVTSHYNDVYLDRGIYPIRVEYIESEDISSISLRWRNSLFPEHPIPSSNLFWADPDGLSQIAVTSGNFYLDKTVENSILYAYSIRARSGSSNSSFSDLVIATPSVRTGIGISPSQVVANPGEELEFDLEMYNDGGFPEEYGLHISINDSFDYQLSMENVYLSPGTTRKVELSITPSLDVEEGNYDFVIEGIPAGIGETKEAVGWIIIDTDPRIMDLSPSSGHHSSDTSVLVTWRTPVISTSTVYLRESAEEDHTTIVGENGTFHQVLLEDLEREKEYRYYVESSTSSGTSGSITRSFRVDSKVVFDEKKYDITIKREYDQSFKFQIENLDDVVHQVEASILNPYDDLIIGFTGDGSEDILMSIPPGGVEELTLAVHAQDAMQHLYVVMLNLSTIDEEVTYVDQAPVKIVLDHVFVDLDITEIGTDPYSLSKRFRITNNGDTVTDLSVDVNPGLSDRVHFEPNIDHGYLRSGKSIEFMVSPFLDFHFPGLEGDLNVSAYDTSYEHQLNFQVPEDWDIFAGSLYPNWGGVPTVYFDEDDQDHDGIPNDQDDDQDGDGIPNGQDPEPLDTDNDGIPNAEDSDDDGDGQPDKSDFFPWDFDNDGNPDEIDPDKDGDGVYNHLDPYPDDHDNDTINNGLDDDDDNDQVPDYKDNSLQDHDNDGWPDWWDPDYDGDGIMNWDDDFPADKDNDGTPDSSDDDIDGDGTPNEDDSDHNSKPGKGGGQGSPGGNGGGGGGGWDEESGEDWYCTNKPELDLFEILSILWKLYNIGKAIFGLAMVFATGGLVPLVTAIIAAVVENAISNLKDSAVNAGLDALARWAGASSWSDLQGSLVDTVTDAAKSGWSAGSSNGPKTTPLRPTRASGSMGLRPGLQQYYPDPMIDTSKLQNVLVTRRNMYVYFHQDGGDGSEIWMAYTKDLGASLKDYKKMTDSPGNAYWPYMDCGSEGNATLVWIDDRDGHDEVYMRRTQNAGKKWTDEIRVTDIDSNKESPIVAYDRDDNIHIFWVDDQTGLKNIFVKKLEIDEYTEEETWVNDYRITYDHTESTQPTVHLGEDDELHLFFLDNETGTNEIYHRKSSSQDWNSWSINQITDTGTEKGEPAVTISKNGTMHLVWRDSQHGESEIYYQMMRSNSGTIGDPVRLTNDEFYSEYPSIDHAGDDLFVSWHGNKTGWDQQYLVMSLDDGHHWTSNKRIPASPNYVDTVLLELEFTPVNQDITPHNVNVFFNGVEIGEIENTVPSGKYLFDVPLDLINMADSSNRSNSVKIKTEHMNGGHYLVVTNWTLMWHYTNMYEFVCAPDQEAADEYVRNGSMEKWIGSDVGVYSNGIRVSDQNVNDGEQVEVEVDVRNMGGVDSRNVKVFLYGDNIVNESRLLGGPIDIPTITQGSVETVTFNIVANSNYSRLFAKVVNEGGGETDESNNVGNAMVEFFSQEPPTCSVKMILERDYTMFPGISLELEAFGANRVKFVSFSNDNETWTFWEQFTKFKTWNLLDAPPGTRAGESDGYKTVYVKVKDIAGLESETATITIYLFMEDPDLGKIPSVEDDKQSLNKPLKITFSGPMNKTSVEEAFSIDPPIEGNITWDDMTMIFTPADGWEEGQEYTVTIGDMAMDVFGRNLTEDINVSFTVVDEDIGDDDDDIVDDDVVDDDTTPDDDDDDTSGVSGAIIATIVIVIILILIAVVAVVIVLRMRGKEEEEEGWGDEE